MKALAQGVIARLPRCLRDPRSVVIAIPYFWLFLFFAIPFLIVLKISFAEAEIAMPPFSSILEWTSEKLSINLDFSNYRFLFEDPLYYAAYLSSIRIAFNSTLLCLLIGYPMAYAIARMPAAKRNVFLMLVILPSWTSFLIRIYAWIGILKNEGLLNETLSPCKPFGRVWREQQGSPWPCCRGRQAGTPGCASSGIGFAQDARGSLT